MPTKLNTRQEVQVKIDHYFRWDTATWSKALYSWEKYLYTEPKKCLELGAREGGLSLLLSDLGHTVICSDLENPKDLAEPNHQAHALNPGNISYEAINILNIPYENEFDIIILKSVLGGVARDHNFQNAVIASEQIHKALKPGGKVLFVENLEGSELHKLIRTKLRPWASYWHYFNKEEIVGIFNKYSSIDFHLYGLIGMHTGNKFTKAILNIINATTSPITPSSWKYIGYGAATK